MGCGKSEKNPGIHIYFRLRKKNVDLYKEMNKRSRSVQVKGNSFCFFCLPGCHEKSGRLEQYLGEINIKKDYKY